MIAFARTTTKKPTADNHTGYAQVIEEWDVDGTPTLKRSYTVGHDLIPKKPGPKLKQKVNNKYGVPGISKGQWEGGDE